MLRHYDTNRGGLGEVVWLAPHSVYSGAVIIDCIVVIDYNNGTQKDEVDAMASITIRNLDNGVKTRLRIRAAEHGRSMEEEARVILRDAVGMKAGADNLASAIRARFAPFGGVELDLPPRQPIREPPSFD